MSQISLIMILIMVIMIILTIITLIMIIFIINIKIMIIKKIFTGHAVRGFHFLTFINFIFN